MVPGSSLSHPCPTLTRASFRAYTWQRLGKCAPNKTMPWFMLLKASTKAVCLRNKGQPTLGSGDPVLALALSLT